MSGSSRYCETPSRSQGKPEKMRATSISNATQRAAPRSAQTIRSAQFPERTPVEPAIGNRSFLADPISSFGVPEPVFGRTLRAERSQTHVAGNKARNALKDNQPAAGPSAMPFQR